MFVYKLKNKCIFNPAGVRDGNKEGCSVEKGIITEQVPYTVPEALKKATKWIGGSSVKGQEIKGNPW